jgi:outer membrane lipoprotein-sorting protein
MLAAARETPGIRLAGRIKHMSTHKRLFQVAAVAAALVIALAVWMLLPSDGKTGVVFADVQRRIERTQTMTLTATAEMKGMRKPMTMKMFFKYPGLMRQEMTMDADAFLPAGTSRPASMPAPEKVINVFDMSGQKGLTLIPNHKKALVYELKNLPAETIARTKEQNLLQRLKEAVSGEHQELGVKKIDGVEAKGYRCKAADMHLATMDIWVDASTGKPLLVEEMVPGVVGGLKVTMTDIVVDPKLDDSLFDMKVPEGYSTENQVVDFNVSEDELTKYLRLMGELLGGEFPKSLTPTPELIQDIEKVGKTKKMSQEEQKEIGKSIQRAMLFQVKTMQGGEFVYAGDGVKLGDKATPIAWYKAKDAKTYRVIYGDLHVEDAQKAPKQPATLPGSPESSTKP